MKFSLTAFFAFIGLLSCLSRKENNPSGKAVYVAQQEDKYKLIRNGSPFTIKGACGNNFIRELKERGGNTIRTYDTARLDLVFADAEKYGIAVIAGLFMPKSENIADFYNDTTKVEKLKADIKNTVLKYKNSPALLMWCVGNELYFPRNPSFNKFYEVYNELVDFIHETDPNHPVTTTVINFDKTCIINIKNKTNTDIISFNVFYGQLKNLQKQLSGFEWYWKGPYFICEWGIDGPWVESGRTPWSAAFELKDYEKSYRLNDCYKELNPNSGRFLGDLVFYWGYKQETTDTWYSFFSKDGFASAMVNQMQYIWTEKKSSEKPPVIFDLTMNKKHGYDNLLLNANQPAMAAVSIKGDTAGLRYEWSLLKEDWLRTGRFINNEKFMISADTAVQLQHGSAIHFTTPAKKGPYRLFIKIYNNKGYFTADNIPFYVVTP